MKNIKTTNYIILCILFISFLIQYPFYAIINILLSSVPLLNILPKLIFYIAIFICMIFVEKSFDKVNVLKTFLVAGLIFIIQTLFQLFYYNIETALVIEVIKPIIFATVLLFGFAWILKKKIKLNRWFWIVGSFSVILNAILIILYYNRAKTTVETVGNDFLSYLRLLTQSTNISSVYSFMLSLLFYSVIYFVFYISIKDKNN